MNANLANWTPPPLPDFQGITGRYARIEKLDPDQHATRLFQAFHGHDHIWHYIPIKPFHSTAQFYKWVSVQAKSADPLFYAVVDPMTNKPLGLFSFLRIAPEHGSIELGYIVFSPALQKTVIATEAMYLMMKWAFDAGYRRFEWKCDAANLPSRRAAQRLGLSYEGIFRQASVVKGRNRDTAWFAAIDKEWMALSEAFDVWLDPANFDQSGQQKERLGNLTSLVRVASDPSLTS